MRRVLAFDRLEHCGERGLLVEFFGIFLFLVVAGRFGTVHPKLAQHLDRLGARQSSLFVDALVVQYHVQDLVDGRRNVHNGGCPQDAEQNAYGRLFHLPGQRLLLLFGRCLLHLELQFLLQLEHVQTGLEGFHLIFVRVRLLVQDGLLAFGPLAHRGQALPAVDRALVLDGQQIVQLRQSREKSED